MNQQTYRNLVSGQTLGPRAGLLRILLTVLSWPYGFAVRVRNGLYSIGLLRVHEVSVPVISVGNLTVGGTGKTPLVAWLTRHIQSKGHRVAVLTRGYKATNQRSEIGNCKFTDEPALLAAMCPGVSIIVDPDRIAGAQRAIHESHAEALVLDDGFQHRRLARDVDIVTVDATSPFGYDRLLPAGLLREPLSGLRRAHAVVITRGDQVSEERLARIEERVRRISPKAVLATAVHAPVRAVVQTGKEIGLEELRGKKVYAFCGIGNPEAFFDTIQCIGCVLVGQRIFDDHHGYTADCLREIRRQGAEKGADYLLTTQKDWTKIAGLVISDLGLQIADSQPGPASIRNPQSAIRNSGPPIAYLAVELTFTGGANLLIALIDRVLGGTMPRKPKV